MKYLLVVFVCSSIFATVISQFICKCGPINYNCNGYDAVCCTWVEPEDLDNCGCCSGKALNESIPVQKALLSPIVIKFKKPDPNNPNAQLQPNLPFNINFGR